MDLRSMLNLAELGIEDDATEAKIVERTQAYINGAYIPKERFDDVNSKYKQQRAVNATLNSQLEELRSVDVDGMKSEIEKLHAANREQKEEFDRLMNEEKLKNALESAFKKAGAKNAKATGALLDMDKIKLTENGLEGFKEQIDALKENEATAFLFEQTDIQRAPTGFSPNKDPQTAPEVKSAGARAAERYNSRRGTTNKKGD